MELNQSQNIETILTEFRNQNALPAYVFQCCETVAVANFSKANCKKCKNKIEPEKIDL